MHGYNVSKDQVNYASIRWGHDKSSEWLYSIDMLLYRDLGDWFLSQRNERHDRESIANIETKTRWVNGD